MATTRAIYVYLLLVEGPVPVGFLEVNDDRRSGHARFRYGDRYLGRRGAIALDPVMLPLISGEQVTQEGFVLFNGIRDAAPDAWGRHLMDRAAGVLPLGEIDYLAGSGDDRVGALAFGPDLHGPRRVAPWLGAESAGERLDLPAMIEAADRLDREEELDEQLRRFLVRGSSALGGARPKATTEHQGTLWIAKFGRRDDTYDICRAEYAAMQLAARCGLDVPRVALRRVFRHDIYLVERFDRVGAIGGPIGRVPFISALTMLGAHESDRGHSYREIAEAVRRHGSSPKVDLAELYRRMVFNILCNNTDDHLRNHGFLHDGAGWRLSPAYDIVPFPQQTSNRELALGVGSDGRAATLSNARSECEAFGLTPKQAEAAIRAMQKVVRGWPALFASVGMSKRDTERLTTCFAQAERTNERPPRSV